MAGFSLDRLPMDIFNSVTDELTSPAQCFVSQQEYACLRIPRSELSVAASIFSGYPFGCPALDD
jgi:hypothetical protein